MTQEAFLKIYNKHKPNKFIRFMFKYFSTESERRDLHLRNKLSLLFVGLFAVGFFSTAFNFKAITKFATIGYVSLLFVMVIALTLAAIMNNIRIRKIVRELDVDIKTYNFFSQIFL